RSRHAQHSHVRVQERRPYPLSIAGASSGACGYNRKSKLRRATSLMPPRTPKGDHAVNRFLPAALLIASLLWCVYWLIHAQGYWEDDAWIHLEFARSVSQGHGFAFNGRVVAGDTAPLWVLLLAGVHALIPQWVTAGKLLTILGAALGLSAVYAFARRMAQHLLAGRAAQLFPAAMLLLVVV